MLDAVVVCSLIMLMHVFSKFTILQAPKLLAQEGVTQC